MKSIFVILLLLSTIGFAQQPTTLTARYYSLRDKAQTFKDYKVIKQTSLDAFWKSVEDSIRFTNTELKKAKEEIHKMNATMEAAIREVKKKEADIEEVVFDSNHITVLGISFHKAAFISLIFIITASLAGIIVLLFIRMKFLMKSLREKSEQALVVNSEYEEYKHRAVERQMKLSRELQNERNRILELQKNK